MSIQPVKMSTGKKIAIAAGAVAAAGLTAFAYARGRQSDAFVKAAEAVKNNVEGAKKLNVLATLKEGGKDLLQVAQLGIAKAKTLFIRKGALTSKDIQKLNELEARKSYATGLAAKLAEKI